MRARAAAEVEHDNVFGTRLKRVRSEPPLVVRWTIDGLTLVAGAGGPLGGDDLGLELVVGDLAHLHVGSAAATVVQPGREGGAALLAVCARVGERACLRWCPEPTVVATGATLESTTTIDCASTSRVTWREVIALGRHEERPGDAISRIEVTVDGVPVLRQETRIGPGAPPGWDGPAVTAGHRVHGTLLLLGPGPDDLTASAAAARPAHRGQAPVIGVPRADPSSGCAATLRLTGGGLLVTALGPSTLSVLRALDAASANEGGAGSAGHGWPG